MQILVRDVAAVHFIMKFLHFVTEKVLSDTFGIPYPIAEALTWLIVATVAALIYRKWKNR